MIYLFERNISLESEKNQKRSEEKKKIYFVHQHLWSLIYGIIQMWISQFCNPVISIALRSTYALL